MPIFSPNGNEGRFLVSRPHDQNSYITLTDSDKVYVDYGCLLVYNADGEIIQVFAPGHWAECVDRELFESNSIDFGDDE